MKTSSNTLLSAFLKSPNQGAWFVAQMSVSLMVAMILSRVVSQDSLPTAQKGVCHTHRLTTKVMSVLNEIDQRLKMVTKERGTLEEMLDPAGTACSKG